LVLVHLFSLLDRWRGPVSVAVFAPGDDYERAVEAIMYHRLEEELSAGEKKEREEERERKRERER
jgi:hypothetical protein